MASYGRMINVSQERYQVLLARNVQFHDNINDRERDVVRVFDPLTARQLQEIQLTREVSRELQKKKREDMKKTTAQTVHENKVATLEENEPKVLEEQKK